MSRYITEFIGTFFLVITIALTGNAIAIGAALMVMIYMGGHISGAHYNPAVSLAIFIRGKLPAKDFTPYLIFQIAGAFAAAAVAAYLTGRTAFPAPAMGVDFVRAVTAEFVFTFALALVVLNVATTQSTYGNNYYGLAIGATVMAGAFAMGPISGAAFNPAVAIGLILMDTVKGGSSMSNILIYLIGPFAGAAVAAIVFRITNPAEFLEHGEVSK